MKDIAGDEDEIRLQLDDLVDHSAHRGGNVSLPLVDAAESLPLVLSETEVNVRQVNQSHRARIALIHWVIFVRTCIGGRGGSPLRPGAGAMVDLTVMLLRESVIQPSRRSIWMVPDKVPDVV